MPLRPDFGIWLNGKKLISSKQDKNLIKRSVLGNEAGRPDVLLYGGIGDRDAYRAPCWPAFQTHVCFLAKGRNGSIGIWVRN